MKWRGRTKEKGYYRFAAANGGARVDYFDSKGESAKRLLMKTPVDGARLSSGFGRRRHPISGYTKQHKGVDFAAPRGTPIKAAGDGVVERADRYGGYGNYVRIRHGMGFKTAYAHLSGFAKGMRAGKRVEQGDVIGYVGSTGASTGPHLHYEVLEKNRHVNPQNLKVATGVSLAGAELEKFRTARDALDAMRGRAAEALAADAARIAENQSGDNSL
jgi:murein DD-endopeptidase MepM/ murein hydrolase activator NlpD